MWPTFYIPLALQADDLISGQPSIICGTFNSTPNVSVPNPPTITDGATQLLVVDFFTTAAGVQLPDEVDPAWKRIVDSDSAVSFGFAGKRQLWFWRVYTTGAADAQFTSAIPGAGSMAGCYTNVVLNRPNVDDRWFQCYTHVPVSPPFAGPFVDHWDTPATGFEVANSGDLLIWSSSSSAATGIFYADNEPFDEDVEFACTPVLELPGAGNMGHTFAAITTRARTANNLLKHTPSLDPASWSYVGLSRVSLQPGISGACQLICNIGSGRHYIEQEVTLEAGKTYQYAATQISEWAVNPASVFWLTYIKPDNTEHGAGAYGGYSPSEFTNSTEIRWDTGLGAPFVGHSTGLDGVFGVELGFLISPTVTGTYKIRAYVTAGAFGGTPTDQPDQDSARVAGRLWSIVSGMVLQEGPKNAQLSNYLPTAGTPIVKGSYPGVLFAPPTRNTVDPLGGWTGLVMRRSGGARPVARLFGPRAQGVAFQFDDYSTGYSWDYHNDTPRGYLGLGCSQVVYAYLSAGTKFYCEMTVDTFGAGGVQDTYSCGACITQSMQDHYNIGTVVGDRAGQYAYMSTGKTWTDGVQDGGTVATWSEGDHIGVGIDFTNWEITHYRNGTLVKTQSIPNDWRRNAMWTAHFGVRSAVTAALEPRFTMNFKGPFGGRKPSGFLAYDFDNEVT